ncbi:hypothetical protein [Fuerstiella marisgermanici]|uniref:Uncharacterized protein n=1 Tax=Fuerstiella marisgermanici TaxID=1891926 RepID=A0A1P8WMK0_9PLAN|nr:hypothetical protein [Fuerstiella marisgermanici]APZ95261.1 hypothetical protein Fuma_04917 [Fuerstiella marisgermanici]
MPVDREHWLDDVDDVIRSRHYTWIPEGLGGEPPKTAMAWVLTDVMHICSRAGIDFDEVMQTAAERFVTEEREQAAATSE